MDELAGDHPGPPPPPLHLPIPPEDLIVEILLRLPPEPIYLFRASRVCKHWRRLVHDARFLRRFREFHGGTPPVLGFFNNQPGPPLFVPTSGGFALSTAAMRHEDWRALDCRHGRALLENHLSNTLLVWDLVTGDQRHLPVPQERGGSCHGAVLCAAGHAANHGDCRSCPFVVVYAFGDSSDTSACTYSSETGVWSEITSIVLPSSTVQPRQTALVGNTLYWLLDNCSIFEYDLDNHSLALTEEFPYEACCSYEGMLVIMPTEDGRLGLAGAEGFYLHLWSLVVSIDGLGIWTHQRVFDLKDFLGPEVLWSCMVVVEPIGFAEDDVIFIYVLPSVYMIHLKSLYIEEVSEKGTYDGVFPYASFYAPGITTGGGDDQAELLTNC